MNGLPPLPPGFELEPDAPPASGGMPALPPGFELEPDELQTFGGVGMNATAGVNEALYGVAGLPVDAVRGAMNLGIKGVNAVTGSDIGTIPEDSFGGSRSIAEAAGAIAPELDPRNTEANTSNERIARGVGQGVGGAVLPAGVAGGLMRAGALAPRASPLVEALAGRSGSVGAVAADAAASGAAGAGSATAQEFAPDEYKPLASVAGGTVGGGLGAVATGLPGLTRAVAEAGGNFAAPLTQGGRERLAGTQLVEAAQDPRAAMKAMEAAPKPEVPGSQPTTFQQTGDMGLGALERASQSKFPAEFQQRRADQNSARRDALDAIQPTGAPEAVSRVLKERVDQIEAETMKDLDDAREWERGAGRGLGSSMDPEVAGGVMRERIQKVRDREKAKEQSLWAAVDPDGTLALSADNARRVLSDTVQNLPASAKPPAGEEAAIHGILNQYGEVSSFREIQALQSRLKTEMRRERAEAGETPAYARMSELNSALFRDLESAAVRKVEQQTQAVARGEMRAEDTVEAAMLRQRESWIAERRAAADETARAVGDDGPTGSRAAGAVRTSSVSAASGGASQSRGRSGAAASDPRLSGNGLNPNFDEAALGRLTAARDATNDRVNTFDNPTLRPMLKRPATTAPYDMAASAVPRRLFTSGVGAFEKIQTYRKAAGNNPKAMQALEGFAVDSLRKTALDKDTGAINPARLESWRRSHADALRAFPELEIRISDASRAAKTVEDLSVSRKAAIDEAQRGAIGKLIGSDDPQDIVRIVGGLFSRQDSVRQLAAIRRRVGTDKEALEGLRKAVSDHVTLRMIGNTEAATSGRELVKADQFQTFVKTNRNALKTVFSDQEIRVMEAVAADLQKTNRSLASVKIPGQSNTAQDTLATRGTDSPTTILGKIAVASATAGGSVGLVAGSPLAATAATIGAGLVGALRQNGIETVDQLVRDALLHPERARFLMTKVPPEPKQAEAMMRALARRYVKAAGAGSMVDIEDEKPRGPVPVPSRGMPQGTDLQRALAGQ